MILKQQEEEKGIIRMPANMLTIRKQHRMIATWKDDNPNSGGKMR